MVKPKWDDKKTKLQWLSERGLTERDVTKWVGFHWESFTKIQLQRAIASLLKKRQE